jgi:hypothetical protein
MVAASGEQTESTSSKGISVYMLIMGSGSDGDLFVAT